MSAYLMPKIIVGGFATVTVASVIFAKIIRPMIFNSSILYIEIAPKKGTEIHRCTLKQKGCT